MPSKREDVQTIMMLPVQTTFRNMDASAAVAARIQEEAGSSISISAASRAAV